MQASSSAQNIAHVSRNGQNLASCGRIGDGHWIHHVFSTADPTHDPLSVSDDGGPDWPASQATATLDASPSVAGILLGGSGSASRGALTGFGVDAVADTRDFWVFTLDQPACFTFSASLSSTTSTATGVTLSCSFGAQGGGGQIFPDPGTSSDAFGGVVIGPGALTRTAGGTLSAGQYQVTLNGRVDGNNAYPFSGSYINSLSLSISPLPCHRGDATCDLVVNGLDIAAFALAVINPAAYAAAFPGCSIANADINGDGVVDSLDIAAFVAQLTTG